MARLPVKRPWAWALAVCSLAAATEAALAGTNVGLRLEELIQPAGSPPLWLWAIIGGLYYVLFFFILRSLVGAPPVPRFTSRALVLAVATLAANAGWNWVFFREKDLWLSTLYWVPYTLIAIALGHTLWRMRSPLFRWYALYLAYFVYATWWGISIWRLNR